MNPQYLSLLFLHLYLKILKNWCFYELDKTTKSAYMVLLFSNPCSNKHPPLLSANSNKPLQQNVFNI